jgi:hypothetical protein
VADAQHDVGTGHERLATAYDLGAGLLVLVIANVYRSAQAGFHLQLGAFIDQALNRRGKQGDTVFAGRCFFGYSNPHKCVQ